MGGPDELPATFSYREARERGVSKRQLYRWRDEGAIEALSRGLYRRVDAPLADTDLVEVAHRAPEATLCLTSALVRHGLSDAIPVTHDVAVPRGRRAPVVSAPVTWHRFDPGTFEIGREPFSLDEQTAMGLYNAPRSVVDAFRMSRQHGSDVAYDALRRWLRGGGVPADVLVIAGHFPRTLPRLRMALEVLL